MYENIKQVGLPKWSDADQTLAKAVQKELKVPDRGLATEIEPLGAPVREEARTAGGSDDIGDVSWNVPTVTLRYPSNIPNLPGHNWSNAISMATPLAHKGATAGAKVMALTMIDLLTRPELVTQAWTYFRDVQTKDTKYQPFISAQDKPAIWLNKKKWRTIATRCVSSTTIPQSTKRIWSNWGLLIRPFGEWNSGSWWMRPAYFPFVISIFQLPFADLFRVASCHFVDRSLG